jgi:hypothetical protein
MMTTAEHRLGYPASSPDPAIDRRAQGRSRDGARLRLILALAGLAALIVWGALSHVVHDPTTDLPTSTDQASSAGQPGFDGRGKWTGYVPY